MLGAEWPSAVPEDTEPFSDGTPRFAKTSTAPLIQHLVWWASHGRPVELAERDGMLIITPKDGYRYFFDADGTVIQVM